MSFLRRNSLHHSRLGKNRKKIQKWRRAVGRHSKIRKNRMGYTKSPRIGFGTNSKDSGLIDGMKPVLVHNLYEVANVPTNSVIVIAKVVGAKKKMELIKKAQELKLPIMNVRGGKNGL